MELGDCVFSIQNRVQSSLQYTALDTSSSVCYYCMETITKKGIHSPSLLQTVKKVIVKATAKANLGKIINMINLHGCLVML